MLEIAAVWLPLLAFIILFVVVVVAEIRWLTRKGWATSSRSTGYVLTTDLLGFGIGSLIVLVILMILLMMTLGPAGRGSNAPESAYWVTSLSAIIFPPIFLVVSKRLFLLIFKIRQGKEAWVYSLQSSLAIVLVVLVPPPLVFFLFWYLSTWK